MKKLKLKLKQKYEKTLLGKNMQLKKELKRQREINTQLKEVNHKLLDVCTLHNIKIREVFLQK